MTDIEHTLCGDENAVVEISEDFGEGFYLHLCGNSSFIKCYMDCAQLQQLCSRLKEWGFEPDDDLEERESERRPLK